VKRNIFFSILLLSLSASLNAQLAVAKIIGKDAGKYKLGYGLFAYYEFPLNEVGNTSVRLELIDIAYFRSNTEDDHQSIGYINIKAGYRKIFSETKTGFYIEPQLGFGRVAGGDGTYGDGLASALEGGYSLEVGKGTNTVNFGLKYEYDAAGKDHTISSVGFRFSFAFNLFKRRDDY
jgi:hypothetical protein